MSMHEGLGQYICEQNPYTDRKTFEEGPPQKPETGEMRLVEPGEKAGSWQKNGTEVELDQGYTHLWYFDGKPRSVKKAIRIEYKFDATYHLSDGTTKTVPITEHLLIGYEGGPGI